MEIRNVHLPTTIWINEYSVTASNGNQLHIDGLNGKQFTVEDIHGQVLSVSAIYYAETYHGFQVKHVTSQNVCSYCGTSSVSEDTICDHFDADATHKLLSLLFEHPTLRLHNLLEYEMKVSEKPLWECLIASLET